MFLSTAQLDVRSPGLGHARSRLQCAVPKWASCDPILPSLRMKGGTGAGALEQSSQRQGQRGCLSIKWVSPGWTYSTRTLPCGEGLGE